MKQERTEARVGATSNSLSGKLLAILEEYASEKNTTRAKLIVEAVDAFWFPLIINDLMSQDLGYLNRMAGQVVGVLSNQIRLIIEQANLNLDWQLKAIQSLPSESQSESEQFYLDEIDDEAIANSESYCEFGL